ncbi:MAG: hypothetical protein WEE03_06110 [Chloroflexota bacterium]
MSGGGKRWRRPGCIGCGSGCGGFLLVIIFGGILSIFPAAFGLGVSIGVPFMESNVTMTGAIGAKQKVVDALPAYTRDRVGGNQNFINNTTTLTLGPAEGVGVFIVGRQDGAPVVDLWIAFR